MGIWIMHNIVYTPKYHLVARTFSPEVPLLSDGELGTLAFRQRYPGLGTLADDEDVGDTGGEGPLQSVLDMDDIETTGVSLPVSNDTSTTHVTSTRDHDDVTSVKLHEVDDFVLFQIEFDGIVHPDDGIGVADGAAIVGNNVGDAFCAESDLSDFEELIGSLLGSDTVDGEAALDIIEEAEMFARLLNRDNIHETGGVSCIRPYFSVNLDQPLIHDGGNFTTVQGIFQAVTEEDGEGKGFAKLVRSRGRAGGVGTRQFIEHP